MPRNEHLRRQARTAQHIASSIARDLGIRPPRLVLGAEPPAVEPLPTTPPHWNWSAEEWSAPQLACFLDVSSSFVRGQIQNGAIHASKGGALSWGSQEGHGAEWEHYRISTDEVRRVVRELILPTTDETFAQRLEKGLKRARHDLPVLKIALESLLNLEYPEGRLRDLILGLAASRPGRRKGNEAINPSNSQARSLKKQRSTDNRKIDSVAIHHLSPTVLVSWR